MADQKKRLFQVLDEMNLKDAANGTATVSIYNQMIEAKKAKGGGHVTMGVEEKTIMDIFLEKGKIPLLLIIDKSEYEKLNK